MLQKMRSRLLWILHSNKKSLFFKWFLKITPAGFSEYFVKKLSVYFPIEAELYTNAGKISDRQRIKGTCAVIRAMPQINPLVISICSIIKYVDQVVVVFNGDTPIGFSRRLNEILSETQRGKIKIHNYKTKINRPGVSYYSETICNPSGSIAKFYNFAFSLSDYNTVIKWDDDMLGFNHRKIFRSPPFLFSSIVFDGEDIIGDITTYPEPRTFKIRKGVKFFDSDYCERLNIGFSLKLRIFKKSYLHLKLVRSCIEE